ncbi:hypothetical protein [Maribellus sediminis]|uniref:hypothetical protein n=1 Tax=Maribellus sediminis TaxID=2696285 RepID=UPI00142FF745|nr:hypothetical protein [Maribellus sediminis]
MLRLFTFALCMLTLISSAQEAKTYLSFEGGGTGIVASANVARTVFTHERYKIVFQSGLGWTPKSAHSSLPIDLPLQLTCNFGKANFFVESGLGGTFIFRTANDTDQGERKTNLYLSPIVGFRHETERCLAGFTLVRCLKSQVISYTMMLPLILLNLASQSVHV